MNNSLLSSPVELPPYYPLETVTLTLVLLDQFGMSYALCGDAAVWAAEAPLFLVFVSTFNPAGPPLIADPAYLPPPATMNNMSATLTCIGQGAGAVPAVSVAVGSEAQPGHLTVTVKVPAELAFFADEQAAEAAAGTFISLPGSPAGITITEGLPRRRAV